MTDPDPQLLPSIRAGSPLEVDLRDSLETIACTGPPELRRQIDAVLRGRSTLREFASTAIFRELASPAASHAADALRAMPPEQRRRIEDQADDRFGTSFA